jgi:hypothetical protein
MSVALSDRVATGHSILITGPTGAGKTWHACALAQYACRCGHSALYQRVPRLQEELRIRHGSGAFGKWLLQLAKTDVLALDNWSMGAIDSTTRSDLFEILMTVQPASAPSSPASYPSSTSTRGPVTPPWLTRSSTASCNASTHHPDWRLAASGTKIQQKGEKYRPIVTADI